MGTLLVPSSFERALAEVNDVAGLKQVHDQLEAVGKLAKKMALALEDQNRIAELRIRAARKAGAILARTVKRGGNSQGGSSAPLPDGISWNQSSRWQVLAKLPEQTLMRYLAAALDAQEEVTVSGFLRPSKAKDLAVHFSSERAEWLTPCAGSPTPVTATRSCKRQHLRVAPQPDVSLACPCSVAAVDGLLRVGTAWMTPSSDHPSL